MAIGESSAPAQSIPAYGGDYANYVAASKFFAVAKDHEINGFVFDYEGQSELDSQADITDHPTEENTPIQDHIAIKPLRITLHGFQGELSNSGIQKVIGELIGAMQSGISIVPPYIGHYTPAALAKVNAALSKAANIAVQINQAVQRANKLVSLFRSAQPSNQVKAFIALKGMQATKQVFVIGTPWGYFDNMAIERVVMIQPEDTNDWSDIRVTFKQITVAKAAVKSKATGPAAAQRSSSVNQGNTKGTSTPVSAVAP
ncbi:MAG: hypothetical protein NTY77_05660 [Elusimicrobia bacterium]|nr:hypothetical protein [Elusimicrobiota bacterium]